MVHRTVQKIRPVGSDILTAEFMKGSVFWDITPCGMLKVNRRFGATSPPKHG
jgi:hypothetical protein